MKQAFLLLITLGAVLNFEVLEQNLDPNEKAILSEIKPLKFNLKPEGDQCLSHLVCDEGCCQDNVCVKKEACIAEVNQLLIFGCVICLVLFILSCIFLFYQRRQTQRDVLIIKEKINNDRKILAEKTKAAIERNTAKL